MHEETIDLFNDHENWPEELAEVLDRYSLEDCTYESCSQLEKDLNAIGYDIDWGLDAEPYNLRKKEPVKFYRYETGHVQSLGGNFLGTILLNAELRLIEFMAIKETSKGYWISNNFIYGLHMKPKWVSKTAKKRYAYPTKEEALKSRIAINRRRIEFLERDLQIAKSILIQCKKELENDTA